MPGARAQPSMVPFVLLILALLTAGLVGLLLLNTAIDSGAFTLRNLQRDQTALAQTQQQLKQDLEASANPSALASKAAALGMVPNAGPVFVNPGDGSILGSPKTATPAPTTPGVSPAATRKHRVATTPSPSASGSASPSVGGASASAGGASPSAGGASPSAAAAPAAVTAHPGTSAGSPTASASPTSTTPSARKAG